MRRLASPRRVTSTRRPVMPNESGTPPENSHLALRCMIPGEPMAQARPRFARIGKGVRAFDPKKSRDGKAAIAAAMADAVDNHEEHGRAYPVARCIPFMDDCVRVIIVAAWACPKGDHRKVRKLPVRWRPKKPDADNIAKLVLDAGNGIWWSDDNQVVKLEVSKLTLLQGTAPYTEIIAIPTNIVL